MRHDRTQHKERIESHVNRHRDKRKTLTNHDEFECFKKFYSNTICELSRIIYTTKKRCISTVKNERYNIKWRMNKNEITIQLKICDTTKQTIFDIVDLINFNVVLKISWLRKTNLQIDWVKNTLILKNQQIIKKISHFKTNENETHYQKMWKMTSRQIRRIARSNSNLFKNASIRLFQSNINITGKKFEEIKQFSKKYVKYKKLSQNNVEAGLLNYQSWDHEIRLQNERESTFDSIYKLAKNEFKILKNYIEKNFKKKFIRLSKLSTEYSILFTLKKNEKLRLCVDYRQLNNITIKNRYALSFISEFQNKIVEIKIFTKII